MPSQEDERALALLRKLIYWRQRNIEVHDMKHELDARNVTYKKSALKPELSELLRVTLESQLQHLPSYLYKIRSEQIEGLKVGGNKDGYNKKCLESKLKSHNLKISGSKAVLINRLTEKLEQDKVEFQRRAKGKRTSSSTTASQQQQKSKRKQKQQKQPKPKPANDDGFGDDSFLDNFDVDAAVSNNTPVQQQGSATAGTGICLNAASNNKAAMPPPSYNNVVQQQQQQSQYHPFDVVVTQPGSLGLSITVDVESKTGFCLINHVIAERCVHQSLIASIKPGDIIDSINGIKLPTGPTVTQTQVLNLVGSTTNENKRVLRILRKRDNVQQQQNVQCHGNSVVTMPQKPFLSPLVDATTAPAHAKEPPTLPTMPTVVKSEVASLSTNSPGNSTATSEENCLSTSTGMKLSEQQEHILQQVKPASSNSGGDNNSDSLLVRITAAAGAGKTTTLLSLAEKCALLGHTSITYLTFSKAAAADGKKRIENKLSQSSSLSGSVPTINARTLHSCAMKLLSDVRKEDTTEEYNEKRLLNEIQLKQFIDKECGTTFSKEIETFLRHATDCIVGRYQQDRSKCNAFLDSAKRQVYHFIYKTLQTFCRASYTLEQFRDTKFRMRNYYPVTEYHRDPNQGEKAGFPPMIYSRKISFYADIACKVWDKLEEQNLKTYDLEMKRCQLQKLKIENTSILLVDESQDMDACQVDWIESQTKYGTHIYLVGDAAQTIYGFRGAKSKFMMNIKNAGGAPVIDCTLTKSWRFGNEISNVSNIVLFAKEKSPQTTENTYSPTWKPYRVEGCGGKGVVTADSILPKWKEGMPITIIATTNATLLKTAVSMLGIDAANSSLDSNVEKDKDDKEIEKDGDKEESPTVEAMDEVIVTVNDPEKSSPRNAKDVMSVDEKDISHVVSQSSQESFGENTGLVTPSPSNTVPPPPPDQTLEMQAPDSIQEAEPIETSTELNAALNPPHQEVTQNKVTPSTVNSPRRCFPKIHINGKGENSGMKKWKSVFKQIQHIYDLYKGTTEAGEEGEIPKVLPEDQFPEFNGQKITWSTFTKEVSDQELSRYSSSVQVVSAFKENTMEKMEMFKSEVMEKSYTADEADIILTTTHAAKGAEWDNVQLCDDFMGLCKVQKIGGGANGNNKRPLDNNPSFQFAIKKFGDDVNLLYVACTRAKKLLSIPPSLKSLLVDCDMLHNLIRRKKLYKEEDKTKSSDICLFGVSAALSIQDAISLYKDVVLPLRMQSNVVKPNLQLCKVLIQSLDCDNQNDSDEGNDEGKYMEGDDDFVAFFYGRTSSSPAEATETTVVNKKTTVVSKKTTVVSKKTKLALPLRMLEESRQADTIAAAAASANRPFDTRGPSPNNKATCRECLKSIETCTERVGIPLYGNGANKDEWWLNYFHASCCPDELFSKLKLPAVYYTMEKSKADKAASKGSSQHYDKKECSPNSLAKCQECKETITEGTRRVGIQVYSNKYEKWITLYYHEHNSCCPMEVKAQLQVDPLAGSTTYSSKSNSKTSSYSYYGYKKKSWGGNKRYGGGWRKYY